ncbi:hypothetical protein [Metabacillus fastidiosus]|uniref:hypothetical protein n=1 Tax=Metabacillus fastidiosus TaxID=1458 RepID=UPI003D2B0FA8
MKMFLMGMWFTMITGLTIYMGIIKNIEGLFSFGIVLLITVFSMGIHVGDKVNN